MLPSMTKKQFAAYISAVLAVFVLSVIPAYLCGEYTARLPILMYHNLEANGDAASTISAEMFESHIKALSEAGYTTITFEELREYAVSGVPLPDRRVMITFDDGYMGVYDTAFPILEKYGMKATVSIVGVFFGQDTYKGLYYLDITPHFGEAEAREMAESGVLSIQSHSYDMHQYIPYETGEPRVGAMRKKSESRDEYTAAFIADFTLAADQLEEAVGERPFVYAYPFGRCTRLTEKLLKDMGVTVTLTISARINTVIKGVPESLYRLGRLNVPGDTTPDELLAMIDY